MKNNLQELFDTVIKNDYCAGCGICAALVDSPLRMKMNENGKYIPVLEGEHSDKELALDVLSACPFSAKSKNETEIGKALFENVEQIQFDAYSGYYLKSFAGYVKEGDYRKKGSSGGFGNWIAAQLLKEKLVDGIIHVKSAENNANLLFEYQVSYDEHELVKGAKSKYYPIELSQVLRRIREQEGRYALIGIPCFIKAVRLLAEQDESIRDRIVYYIGLVCGHLKSEMFARSIGWQLGIAPDQLTGIDFRKKLVGKAASDYGVEVIGKREGREVRLSSPTKELYTTNWGHGLFKYHACEFCDDVLAETADITVGDAWLPEYTKDSMGTNIVIVRNPTILRIIEASADKLYLEEIGADKVYQSQAGGIRHRRDGLAYRLYLKDKNNEWRPPKRVQASKALPRIRRRIYEERMKLSQESFKAYQAAERAKDFQVFIDYMDPIIKHYTKVSTPSLPRRVASKAKRGLKKMIRSALNN